jgi:hypothetical protein
LEDKQNRLASLEQELISIQQELNTAVAEMEEIEEQKRVAQEL